MEDRTDENRMTVDLRDLEEGETRFEYEQVPADLDLAPEGVAFSGPIRTSVDVYKLSDALSATGTARFRIRVDCARCNEEIELSYEAPFNFVFQKGKPRGVEGDEDETLVWLDEGTDELDLGGEVRDYILLEIPINPVCEQYASGTCPNLKEIETIEREAGGESAEDPRWAALKALRDND